MFYNENDYQEGSITHDVNATDATSNGQVETVIVTEIEIVGIKEDRATLEQGGTVEALHYNGRTLANPQCVSCRRASVDKPGMVCGLCASDEALIDMIDPTLPVIARPGSHLKILVMCARARAKVPLFNPLDGAA